MAASKFKQHKRTRCPFRPGQTGGWTAAPEFVSEKDYMRCPHCGAKLLVAHLRDHIEMACLHRGVTKGSLLENTQVAVSFAKTAEPRRRCVERIIAGRA
jgi:hypothetical protein